ncbi:putative ribonuclease H protein [Sesbania bispinosa]|nr:putative ribonuclease H protein [Sesbania bispinosa]
MGSRGASGKPTAPAPSSQPSKVDQDKRTQRPFTFMSQPMQGATKPVSTSHVTHLSPHVHASQLGKLVWQLLNGENKLWVQVLLNRYVPKGSVLNPRKASSPSPVWRSICMAVKELREGLIMKLEAGNSSIWDTDWLGCGPLSSLLDFIHISDTYLCVKDLVEHGTWNLGKLYTHLPTEIRDRILSTPPQLHLLCWIIGVGRIVLRETIWLLLVISGCVMITMLILLLQAGSGFDV